MGRYDDLLAKQRPQYAHHPPMARKNRAAQFAPFAALRGYDECIAEAGRKTESCPQLDEQEIEALDRLLRQIYDALPQETEITVNYFVPDACKEGGQICTHRGTVCKIDPQKKTIHFQDGKWMEIKRILHMEIITQQRCNDILKNEGRQLFAEKVK